jgi:hypothetical protein
MNVSESVCVGDAARYTPMDVIVRVQQLDGRMATVQTPSLDEYKVPLKYLLKLELNSLELATAFSLVVDGTKWGGWNKPAKDRRQKKPLSGNAAVV